MVLLLGASLVGVLCGEGCTLGSLALVFLGTFLLVPTSLVFNTLGSLELITLGLMCGVGLTDFDPSSMSSN